MIARTALIALLLGTMTVLFSSSIRAGDVVLSNNTGTQSTIWFISGEPSLVMNGFDLQARGIQRPVQLDRLSIDVETPVAGESAVAVVYEDANGGSPADATLVGRSTVNITQAGVFTVTFNPPLEITQPVIWVGFYLPVDFEFRADTSGSSVLTYWAWTPGETFDLSSPSNAQVLGPADGSAPVSIDMGGVARITAELITGGQTPAATITSTVPASQRVSGALNRIVTDDQGRIIQAVGDASTNLAPIRAYIRPDCNTLYYDTTDINVTYRSGVVVDCKVVPQSLSPTVPDGYIRQGALYDVTVFGLVSPGTVRMPYPITHCISVSDTDLERAVIGVAYGSPREWEILPSIRYGSFVCADIFYAGNISYFVPN
ncbi:MAG: hypothetical protein ACOCX3_00765 [Chloroflexota bacterium]